ncbi:hypothetical protein QBC35DRAFT_550352, partial [Podospora australis]
SSRSPRHPLKHHRGRHRRTYLTLPPLPTLPTLPTYLPYLPYLPYLHTLSRPQLGKHQKRMSASYTSFNVNSEWESIDIGNNSVPSGPGYRYVSPFPVNSEKDEAVISTDQFPLPPTYSHFYSPRSNNNYSTFPPLPATPASPTFPGNNLAEEEEEDCYSDHLDLDDYLAPSVSATASRSASPSCPPASVPASGFGYNTSYQPRKATTQVPLLMKNDKPTATKLTFFPPPHRSAHLTALSDKVPLLLPLHHQQQQQVPSSCLRTASNWQNIQEFLSKKVGNISCPADKNLWYNTRGVAGFLLTVILLFFILCVLLGFGKFAWDGFGMIVHAVKTVTGNQLCTEMKRTFCHLAVEGR